MTRPLIPSSFLALASVILPSTPGVAQEAPPPDWENPAVFAAGKELPRASFVPFPDRETALALGPSERRASLNGRWRFHFLPRPALAPDGFQRLDFDDSGGGGIGGEFCPKNFHDQPPTPIKLSPPGFSNNFES